MLDRILRARTAFGLVAAVLAAPFGAVPIRAQAVLPPHFVDQTIANGLDQPVTMTRMSDGRVLLTERGTDQVRLITRFGLMANPVGHVDSVAHVTEQGLIGVAVDPGFPQRPYLYIQYDVSGLNVIRIARYTLTGDLNAESDGQLTWDPASRFVVIGDLEDSTSAHNAGTLRFGPDGMLYSSVGNDLAYCKAVYTDQLIGKILRLDVSHLPDGPGGPPDIGLITPPDNPFTGIDAHAGLVWEMGLRNPFVYQVDPVSGNLFIGDVGDNTYEELDLADEPGMNFGYPFFEGPMPTNLCTEPQPPNLTFPIYYYDRTEFLNGAVIIPGGQYHEPAVQGPPAFPAEYDHSVFLSDLGEGFLRRIALIDGSWQIAPPVPGQPDTTDWALNMDGVSDYFEAPDGSLWYLKFAEQFGRYTGEVHRIFYDDPPLAAAPPPVRFEFAPPRPVPAHGPVTLGWTLPAEARIRLAVLDVAGREVARLVDDALMPAGPHSLSWDGRDAAGRGTSPGVYFARLRAGSRQAVQRMIVIR